MAVITHIGLAVDNLDKAIDWYENTLGFKLIAGPYSFSQEKEDSENMTNDLLGKQIKKMRNAHLTGDNQVGVELFEFQDPKTSMKQRQIHEAGFFHICLVVDNVEEKAKEISRTGGTIRSDIWNTWPGKPYHLVYCEDPFGNIIELYSHSTELMHGNKET
ncbi:VOC family protein [Niallia taxi]|uniref:VOC family protein n=1 Tax=Niallia taxi TaxID=2499688 RepID=UPI0012480720|nr:VOC family protein [Niallia taxi]MCM3216221.1 VOC family protein [Niallia taxi]